MHFRAGEQAALFEYREVLHSGGQRNTVWGGDLADGGAAAAQPVVDDPAITIGEGGEHAVE